MAVPSYEIYISSLADPSFHFINNEIKEPSTIQGVDIIGDKLSIDTFSVIVYYSGENIDGLRTLPFGTPVWYFKNGILVYKFYINTITRVNRIGFKLECVSAIGLLDKSSHIGGVYAGQTVSDVLEEIIGDIVDYSIDEDVATTQVFGYLPFQSRRDNLHQLMFAHNISILRDADGDMRFTYLRTEDNPDVIDANRIYINGQVEYPAVATEVIVIEHSYQYDENEDEVTLFDNTSSTPASHKRIIFDTAPIYVPSLRVSETLTIEVAHPNFVIVSGIGVLVGRPYYDNVSSISRENETDGEQYTVQISNATLVNVLNSEFVADRVISYYSSAKKIKGDLKIANEAVGHRYSFIDAFGEQVTGYLHKVTTYASSFVKATSEFISGYVSECFGNNYTHYIEATEPCNIIVPQGCTRLRFVIIGGGEGGTRGDQSTSNSDWIHSSELNAGEPGEAGDFGEGGNIREIVINNPTPGSYHCSIGVRGTGTSLYNLNPNLNVISPTASYVTCPDETVYSSDDSSAYKCVSGVMNIFTGSIYGKSGKEGIDGGKGGRGSYTTGEDGEDVYYDGVLYSGGTGAKEYIFNFNHSEAVVEVGGGGGSGAMAYVNGGSARRSSTYRHTDETASRNAADYETAILFISIPNGTTGQVPEIETDRGCGGNAGCGGAAIGGPGVKGSYDDDYYDSNNKLVYRHVSTSAEPNSAYGIDDFNYIEWRYGTPGRDGGRGIIIAYADAELEIENEEKLPTPVLTAESGSSSSAISFEATDLAGATRYYVWKKILSVGPNDEGSAEMNYQKYLSLGIWEPRGYFDTDENETAKVFTDSFPAHYTNHAPVANASYVYRIKSYGDEELGESDWSNEVVVGFGMDQYDVNPILAAFSVYYNTGYGVFVLTDLIKPVVSSTAYENFQSRKSDELQWHDLIASASNATGAVDRMHKNQIGQEIEYRLYVSGPDKLSSQFSNSITATIEEVTNKLFAPYIFTPVPYSYGDYCYTAVWFIFADSRATRTNFEYKRHDRSWWSSFGYANNSNLSPVTKNGTLNHVSLSSNRTTYDFRAYNIADGYDNSDSRIVVYEEPVTLLKWPEEVNYEISNGSVIFTWTEVEHAASYKIFRKLSSESSYSVIYNGSALTYTDSSATSGETYIYMLMPIAEAGYTDGPVGGFNVEIVEGGTGGRCATPVITSTYVYDPLAFIKIEWTAIPNASGYMLERKKGDGLYDILEENLPSSTTSYTDINTEYQQEYSYRLTALGNNVNYGKSELSNVVTATAMNGEIVTLDPPTFALAVADRFAGSVQITWDFVLGAQAYLIERKLHSGSEWLSIQVSSATRAYTDEDTTYPNEYDYRMKTIGNGINVFSSDYSEVSSITVSDPYEGLIYLNPVSISLTQVTDLNTVTVTWGDNVNAIGYKLERKLHSASAWSTVYSGMATTYSDANLTWEAEYDYQITALGDYSTFRDSVPTSDTIEIELPTSQQLATPVLSGAEATVTSGKAITLTWSAIANASSYTLERKLSTDTDYAVVIEGILPSAVSYTDTSVLGGRTYNYRLTAIGDNLYYTDSIPSNAVDVALSWSVSLIVLKDGVGEYPYYLTSTVEKYMNISGSTVNAVYGAFYSGTKTSIYAATVGTVPDINTAYYAGCKSASSGPNINLTNYSVIQVRAKKPSSSEAIITQIGSGNGLVYLVARETTDPTGYSTGASKLLNLTEEYQTFELDVSNLTGNHTIAFQLIISNPTAQSELWVSDIVLYG